MSGRIPRLILFLTLSLIGIGLTVIYSASSNKASVTRHNAQKPNDPSAQTIREDYHGTHFLLNQSMFAVGAIALMLMLSGMDHHRLRKAAPYLLGFTFILLLLVFVPGIGKKVNGANRWLDLRVFNFQPSEMAKLAMIIFTARFLMDRQRHLDSFTKGLLPSLVTTAVFSTIIIVEPDFGAAAMVGTIVLGMWFVAGMKKRHMAVLVSFVLPLAVAAVVTSPYRMKRIIDFVQLLTQGLQKDQHTSQSIIAIGSGGLHGLGLGNSVQKYAFLPEAHTDFVFAVLAEEMGFIFSGIVVLAYVLLIMLGWFVALRAADSFGGYLAAGVTLMISLSVCANLMIVTGLFPPKGMALPFLSYGGSSLLFNCIAVGILINVAKYNEESVPATPRRRRR